MESTASEYFGRVVADYDSLIRRAVPRYGEMRERLVEYLPRRATRVLELGCGTGNLSLALAQRYPDAALTLVDASPEMLAVTRTRLEELRPAPARVTFLQARFEDLSLEPGSFDLITSCISLHHVADKAALFDALRGFASDDASFVLADQMAGSSAREHELNWQRWLDYCREPGNCSAAEIQALLEHAQAHDHYVSVPEHLRLLERAGFADLDCVWRNWMWGILVARSRARGR